MRVGAPYFKRSHSDDETVFPVYRRADVLRVLEAVRPDGWRELAKRVRGMMARGRRSVQS